MSTQKKTIALEVVELATGEVIHTVPLTGDKSERFIEKVMMGMLRNMDTERFAVREKLKIQKGGST